MEDLLSQGFGYFPSLNAYQKCCSECSGSLSIPKAGAAIRQSFCRDSNGIVGSLWISFFLAADNGESGRFFHSLKDANGETLSPEETLSTSGFVSSGQNNSYI